MTWRAIPGFTGYEVSDHGAVRSWRCGGRFGAGLRRTIPRVLTATTTHDGYYRVFIRSDAGKARNIYVHQLVLFAFVGHCPIGYEASHKNGDQQVNTRTNLEWETPTENNRRKLVHGTQPIRRGEDNPAAKVSNVQRAEIRRRYAAGGISQRSLGQQYGLAQSTVGDIVAQRVPS